MMSCHFGCSVFIHTDGFMREMEDQVGNFNATWHTEERHKVVLGGSPFTNEYRRGVLLFCLLWTEEQISTLFM